MTQIYLFIFSFIFYSLDLSGALVVGAEFKSHFECKALGGDRYRPYYMQANASGTAYKDYSKTPKGLLGQNPMTSQNECMDAIGASNAEHGVICSRTGIGGWKPTLFTGTVPGRPDFGYLGGSSIEKFDDCLVATKNSSAEGVCFWGGSQWFISPINQEGIKGGPFSSLSDCVKQTQLEFID